MPDTPQPHASLAEPSQPAVSLLYVTAGSTDEARSIAQRLIEEKLIACANILEGMRSLYWWDGQVQQGDEAVLLLKTRASLVEEVTERVKALHSYSCPCVVELPVGAGNPDFLRWICAETGGRSTVRSSDQREP